MGGHQLSAVGFRVKGTLKLKSLRSSDLTDCGSLGDVPLEGRTRFQMLVLNLGDRNQNRNSN